ncbi:MAG TPA: hypothetical protein VGG85_14080 [Terracidiphilus sp.]|jgi:vancomycin resistance protein YoaR
MQILQAGLILTLTLTPIILRGQTNAAAPQPEAPAAVASAPVTASSVLEPVLTQVQTTLTSLKTDKWKKGSVRDEAAENVKDVLHDLQTNLPPLVNAADGAPGALSKAIPLMKHLDALYDVILRIEEGSRVSAPSDQIDSLEQTLKSFGTARITYYDSLQQSASGQEKQVVDLQATLKAQQAAAQEAKPAPAPVPCTPPKPTVKKKRPAPAKAPPATAPAQPKTP